MAGKARPVSASRLVLARVLTPRDATVYGKTHGGNIMRLADTAAGVVAIRHSRRNCVTSGSRAADGRRAAGRPLFGI